MLPNKEGEEKDEKKIDENPTTQKASKKNFHMVFGMCYTLRCCFGMWEYILDPTSIPQVMHIQQQYYIYTEQRYEYQFYVTLQNLNHGAHTYITSSYIT